MRAKRGLGCRGHFAGVGPSCAAPTKWSKRGCGWRGPFRALDLHVYRRRRAQKGVAGVWACIQARTLMCSADEGPKRGCGRMGLYSGAGPNVQGPNGVRAYRALFGRSAS